MKITAQEQQTGKSGKPFYAYTLEDGSKATGFDPLPLNTELEGYEVVTNGNFRNLKKNPMHPRPAGLGGGMAKAMETKATNIREAQENKHEAIKQAGAMRDATLIALAELASNPLIPEDFKTRWTYWKAWLLQKAEEPF